MVLIFFVAERAPDSLKVEQIEVNVPFHPVQVVDRQFIFMVSERAHLAELALVQIVRVRLAEFGLVLLWVVEVFDCVVRTVAVISEWAVVGIVAESRCVGAKRTASVFHAYIVVEETALRVVGSLEVAWQGFESIEIKEHDAFMVDGLLGVTGELKKIVEAAHITVGPHELLIVDVSEMASLVLFRRRPQVKAHYLLEVCQSLGGVEALDSSQGEVAEWLE
jgi:hypothetical protein